MALVAACGSCGSLTLGVCLFRVTDCSKCHSSPTADFSASQPISVSGIGVKHPYSTTCRAAPIRQQSVLCLAPFCPSQPFCAILDLVSLAVPATSLLLQALQHSPPARQESQSWAVTQLPNYFRCIDFKHTHKQLLCLTATRPSASIMGTAVQLQSPAGPGWCWQEMFCTACPGHCLLHWVPLEIQI